jgi:hypothetical protein
MHGANSSDNFRRVLGRVNRQEFVGRVTELDRTLAQASPKSNGRGLLLLMKPLLVSPNFRKPDRSTLQSAHGCHSRLLCFYPALRRFMRLIEFLSSFLQQYIAFRRNEPALWMRTDPARPSRPRAPGGFYCGLNNWSNSEGVALVKTTRSW